MLITFFLILFVGAAISIYAGIRWQKWLLCTIASILFLVLAFSAFSVEVPSGGLTIVFQEIVIVLLCWAAAIISLIFTLIGMISYIRDTRKKEDAKQSQQPGMAG